jgi:dTDP-glucose 4,6-dehydratase
MGRKILFRPILLGPSGLKQFEIIERSDGGGRNFRFVHVSTDEVYGSHQRRACLYRGSCLSRTAPISEQGCQRSSGTCISPHLRPACAHDKPLQQPRPVSVRKSSFRWSMNALAGKPLPVYGDGRQIRDWLYVEDHCNAICRVLVPAFPAKRTT